MALEDIVGKTLRRDGSASRRVGIEPIGRQALLIWAEASDPLVARERADRIADALTAQTQRPAKLLSSEESPPASVSQPPPRDDASMLQAQYQTAQDELRAADARLAAFDSNQSFTGALPSASNGERSQRTALQRAKREAERALQGLRAGQRVELPAAWRSPISDRYDEAAEKVATLRNAIAELSKTLLDDHPRMRIARLRLADLEEEQRAAGADLETQLQTQLSETAAQEQQFQAQDNASAEAEAARKRRDDERQSLANKVEIARGVVERLQQSVAASQDTTPAANPEAKVVTAQPSPIERRVQPTRMRHISIWPAAMGGAMIGFLGSAAALTLGRHTRSRRSGTAIIDAISPPVEAPTSASLGGFEFATVDDVIDGLMTSSIRRVVVASPVSVGERPLSVDIARRLSLRGRSVALVDLSTEQNSSRAMGVAPDASGMADLIRADAKVSDIMRSDFATAADVVAGGRASSSDKRENGLGNRDALKLIEHSYQTLVVDFGNREPSAIRQALDNDAALLVNAEPCVRGEIETAITALRAEGLMDLILVRDRPMI